MEFSTEWNSFGQLVFGLGAEADEVAALSSTADDKLLPKNDAMRLGATRWPELLTRLSPSRWLGEKNIMGFGSLKDCTTEVVWCEAVMRREGVSAFVAFFHW